MFRRYKTAAGSGGAAALDAVATPIMIADTRYDIAYMNPAMTALLEEAEDDLRRERPGFDVAQLRGKNIDLFDIEPAGRRGLADLLATARRATIVIGKRVFDLTAKSLPAGGALIEWSDAAERLASLDQAAQLAAIRKSQAVIEFNLDGTVITANQNFLNVMGYTLAEIQGKHHGIFVDPAYRDSADYKEFWAKLNRGEYLSAEFKRIAKGGKEVWLQASYNPVVDQNGTPFKVFKFATDVTQEKLRNADYLGQIAAIGKSQAVIEFRLDGTIITANENFLAVMGYTLAEIQGKHHSLFVEPLYRDSDDYKEFWAKLNRGEYQTAEFKRIAKGGREVYIQATYNPIRDLDGKPFKVVKFAVDVTQQVIARKKAEHVRSMLESVAAGAEQLNASVKEIASSMSKSRDTTRSAVERVDVADHSTRRLAETSQAMGGIVELISNITNQINLLALNATIESARAGDAGKGFAVVANEVKNLANQAKGATEQISKEIAGLRGVSDEVTNALDAIKHSINAITEYVASTATAVEEQSTVANEMSANMQRAAAEANSLGAAA